MTNTLVQIRDLRADDEAEWHRLWAGYLVFYEATVAPETTRRTWDRLRDPGSRMFCRIAQMQGAVAGFVVCVLHEGSWSVQPTCYLEDLFVDPGARGAGIGRALLDDLVTLGAERGWSSLYWHTRADNVRARALYDRYVPADGFVRYRLTLPAQGEP